MFQKIVFFVGAILIVLAVVLLLGNLGDSTFPVFIGLLGIIVIGAFFLSKKKRWLISNK